jgi:hypothetical protein
MPSSQATRGLERAVRFEECGKHRRDKLGDWLLTAIAVFIKGCVGDERLMKVGRKRD